VYILFVRFLEKVIDYIHSIAHQKIFKRFPSGKDSVIVVVRGALFYTEVSSFIQENIPGWNAFEFVSMFKGLQNAIL